MRLNLFFGCEDEDEAREREREREELLPRAMKVQIQFHWLWCLSVVALTQLLAWTRAFTFRDSPFETAPGMSSKSESQVQVHFKITRRKRRDGECRFFSKSSLNVKCNVQRIKWKMQMQTSRMDKTQKGKKIFMSWVLGSGCRNWKSKNKMHSAAMNCLESKDTALILSRQIAFLKERK